VVEKKELVNLNIKLPKTLKDLMAKYVKCDLHTNLSEFARDALREKIQRDAPKLAQELFQEASSEESE
jgi:Arc/MetJ-type ribon-helix-helix transcriptional regulator